MKKNFKVIFVVLAVLAGFAFTGCNFDYGADELPGKTFRYTNPDNPNQYDQFTFNEDGTYLFEQVKVQNSYVVDYRSYVGKYKADSKLHFTDEKLTIRYDASPSNGSIIKNYDVENSNDQTFFASGKDWKYNFDGKILSLKRYYVEWEYELIVEI